MSQEKAYRAVGPDVTSHIQIQRLMKKPVYSEHASREIPPIDQAPGCGFGAHFAVEAHCAVKRKIRGIAHAGPDRTFRFPTVIVLTTPAGSSARTRPMYLEDSESSGSGKNTKCSNPLMEN